MPGNLEKDHLMKERKHGKARKTITEKVFNNHLEEEE